MSKRPPTPLTPSTVRSIRAGRLDTTAGSSDEAPFKFPDLLSWQDLQALPLPPDEPIIAPWLNSGESCLLWGGTGSGKSMVALSLAIAVAGGGRVLGWSCPKPRRVLWVDGEMSRRTITKRLPFLAQTVEGLAQDLAGRNLQFYVRTMQPADARTFDINEPSHAAELIHAVTSGGIDLVIFDNLSTLSDGIDDENSAACFKPMQALCAKLKGVNVACIMVHHAGKMGNTYRGSSNIGTTFERILGIIHDPEEAATKLSAKVKLEKFRDEAPEGFSPEFHLELPKPEHGEKPRWVVKDSSPARASFKLYNEGEHTTNAEFVDAWNKRNGESRKASNFSRDFKQEWRKAGIPEDRISAAGEAMRERREASEEHGF